MGKNPKVNCKITVSLNIIKKIIFFPQRECISVYCFEKIPSWKTEKKHTFSQFFFHSALEKGLYCKPKYRAILFTIIKSIIPFNLILVISTVGITVPSIFCELWNGLFSRIVKMEHWMKSWIWLYLARRQMLDKSDITFVGRQKRLKLRQICHHICPRQMYNKCIINTTPYLLSDKYRVTLNKFEAENSDVLITMYISPHWLLSVFSRVMSGFEFLEPSCYVISIEKKSEKEVVIK